MPGASSGACGESPVIGKRCVVKYRTLGRTGFLVSEVGFGTWGIGGGWGRKDDVEADLALRRAQELGVNFFDTALVYGNGHSEQLLGWAVKGNRDKVYLATKVPPKNYRWPVSPEMSLKDTFSPEWILQCVERSLPVQAIAERIGKQA